MLLFTSARHAMRSAVNVQLQVVQQPPQHTSEPQMHAQLVITDQGRGFSEDVLQRFGRDAHDMDALWPMSALSVGLTACKRAFCALHCGFAIANAQPEAKRKGGRVTVHLPMPSSPRAPV